MWVVVLKNSKLNWMAFLSRSARISRVPRDMCLCGCPHLFFPGPAPTSTFPVTPGRSVWQERWALWRARWAVQVCDPKALEYNPKGTEARGSLRWAFNPSLVLGLDPVASGTLSRSLTVDSDKLLSLPHTLITSTWDKGMSLRPARST